MQANRRISAMMKSTNNGILKHSSTRRMDLSRPSFQKKMDETHGSHFNSAHNANNLGIQKKFTQLTSPESSYRPFRSGDDYNMLPRVHMVRDSNTNLEKEIKNENGYQQFQSNPDKQLIRKYMSNSSNLSDKQLDEIVFEIESRQYQNLPNYGYNQYKQQVSKAINPEKVSKNLYNQINRDQKSLETYDRYQEQWYKNIDHLEKKRRRHTNKFRSKVCQSVMEPEILMQDRSDMELEKKRNKDLLDVACPTQNPFQQFTSSLRKANSRNNYAKTNVPADSEFGADWLRIKSKAKRRSIMDNYERTDYQIEARPQHMIQRLNQSSTLKKMDAASVSPDYSHCKFYILNPQPEIQKEIISKPIMYNPRYFTKLKGDQQSNSNIDSLTTPRNNELSFIHQNSQNELLAEDSNDYYPSPLNNQPLSIMSKYNFIDSNEKKVSRKQKSMATYFKKQVQEKKVNIEKKVPCSLPFVEHLNEMIVKGQSKLKEEYKHAHSIPEESRIIINPECLNMEVGMGNVEETIEEFYEGKHQYFS